MKKYILSLLTLAALTTGFAQNKNFLDTPFLETQASADSLVTPDRIYLAIQLQEADAKDRVSLEKLETRMVRALEKCDIDTGKQLTMSGLSSNFQSYFLKGQKVLKQKGFELLVYDAATAGCVLYELEQLGVSNVRMQRSEYSKMEQLQTELKALAVLKARNLAEIMAGAVEQKVGKAVYISDSGNYGPVYGPVMAMRAASDDMGREKSSYEAIDAEFRKIKVEVNVQVKFLLE
ncbi:SIMPL domain-containing protein [Robiginitalea sp. M366]|uniref:SIMPL domain-containing protein n=1 Tax=Robiginitalea aestuariiviva TaxID=3036903 RepID=UPI00240DD0F1|nr:SIMPL domain-containing protein [Robiginitalea aestuariiviva]MDG1570906.1 SIMPL domain-containing protein [Robiginitalea aestuariiviva]